MLFRTGGTWKTPTVRLSVDIKVNILKRELPKTMRYDNFMIFQTDISQTQIHNHRLIVVFLNFLGISRVDGAFNKPRRFLQWADKLELCFYVLNFVHFSAGETEIFLVSLKSTERTRKKMLIYALKDKYSRNNSCTNGYLFSNTHVQFDYSFCYLPSRQTIVNLTGINCLITSFMNGSRFRRLHTMYLF